MAYTLHFSKPRFKFSSSHFTIFSEQEAERLHGHNYRVQLKLSFAEVDPETGLAVDFNDVKGQIMELCNQLDEKVLIPTESPYLSIGDRDDQVEVQYNKLEYSFPRQDCEFLNIRNVCSEELALWFWQAMAGFLSEQGISATQLGVTIIETQGQAVTYSRPLNP